MEISIAYPIQTMYGRIGDFHFYHFNGRTYLRRNPKCTKPKSPAQLECMENFKAKYCKKKLKKQNTQNVSFKDAKLER